MTPSEVLAKHTSRELTEWEVYLDMYPVGEWRADLRNGILASLIANILGGSKGRRYKPEDFMPKFGGKEKTQTEEQQRAAAEALVLAFGGTKGKL